MEAPAIRFDKPDNIADFHDGPIYFAHAAACRFHGQLQVDPAAALQ
jgi:hypothetical protein